MSTDQRIEHLYESNGESKRREAAAHNAAHPVDSYPIETHSENRKARRRIQMLRGMLTPTHEVPDVYWGDVDPTMTAAEAFARLRETHDEAMSMYAKIGEEAIAAFRLAADAQSKGPA